MNERLASLRPVYGATLFFRQNDSEHQNNINHARGYWSNYFHDRRAVRSFRIIRVFSIHDRRCTDLPQPQPSFIRCTFQQQINPTPKWCIGLVGPGLGIIIIIRIIICKPPPPPPLIAILAPTEVPVCCRGCRFIPSSRLHWTHAYRTQSSNYCVRWTLVQHSRGTRVWSTVKYKFIYKQIDPDRQRYWADGLPKLAFNLPIHPSSSQGCCKNRIEKNKLVLEPKSDFSYRTS